MQYHLFKTKPEEKPEKQKILGSDDLISKFDLIQQYDLYVRDAHHDNHYSKYTKDVAGKQDFTPDHMLGELVFGPPKGDVEPARFEQSVLQQSFTLLPGHVTV
ncbi:hypothetical protein HDV06_000563 [Boothiomyces sp. JEL0866]|nr:hypothetical protein HDV06_000563 [Boothiomyces sp. JEL0866]